MLTDQVETLQSAIEDENEKIHVLSSQIDAKTREDIVLTEHIATLKSTIEDEARPVPSAAFLLSRGPPQCNLGHPQGGGRHELSRQHRDLWLLW